MRALTIPNHLSIERTSAGSPARGCFAYGQYRVRYCARTSKLKNYWCAPKCLERSGRASLMVSSISICCSSRHLYCLHRYDRQSRLRKGFSSGWRDLELNGVDRPIVADSFCRRSKLVVAIVSETEIDTLKMLIIVMKLGRKVPAPYAQSKRLMAMQIRHRPLIDALMVSQRPLMLLRADMMIRRSR